MTKTGPQLTARTPLEIAIACFPDAQDTCIHGLTDLFWYADYFARMHGAGLTPDTPSAATASDLPFIVTRHVRRWSERDEGNGMAGASSAKSAPALVIVPAFQFGPPPPRHAQQASDWVAQKHAEGAVVAAVCGGVFVLADSGLLSGRRVTTHWMFAAELQRRYPDLRVDSDRAVIDDADVVTAGGVLAWADLGLTLVERLLGRTAMLSTARFMLMDPPGREQRFYGEFTPPLRHGDKEILSIQRWLQANTAVTCTGEKLAERAGLGPRTFLRRFVRATGMTPSDYHQRLRIARSRELLEFSRESVDRVAFAAGYDDTRGFRRAFKRLVGLSPAEYRRRFQPPHPR